MLRLKLTLRSAHKLPAARQLALRLRNRKSAALQHRFALCRTARSTTLRKCKRSSYMSKAVATHRLIKWCNLKTLYVLMRIACLRQQ